MKRFIITLALTGLILVGCSSTAPSYNQPKITYTQTSVKITLPRANNQQQARERFRLRSTAHAGVIATAIARTRVVAPITNKPIKIGAVTINPSPAQLTEAVFTLPRSAPGNASDICFYVTNSVGNVISSGSDLTRPGFTNRIWEDTFILDSLKQNTANEAQGSEKQIEILSNKLASARNYLASSALLSNNACVKPQLGRSPEKPFPDDYLNHKQVMPETLCLNYANMHHLKTEGLLRLIYLDKADKLEKMVEPMLNAVSFINQRMGKQYAALRFEQQITTYFPNQYDRPACYGTGCSLQQKFLNVGQFPYRQMVAAYHQCVADIRQQIEGKIKTYNNAYNAWLSAPETAVQACQAKQQDILQLPQQIAQQEQRLIQTNEKLRQLKQRRSRPIHGNSPVISAHNTSCSINRV